MRTPHKLASLTALAVGAASMSLLASPAAQAVPPAGADLTGVVTVGGVPAAGLLVFVSDVEADGSEDQLGYARTEANGEYWFDFDAAATAGGSSNGGALDKASDRPQVRILVLDGRQLSGDTMRGRAEWYDDAPTFNRATPITRSTTGVTTVPTFSISPQAGIRGTVSVPVPAGYLYSGSVEAYDSDERRVDAVGFDNDPATTGRGFETSYTFDNLNPGQSYTLRYFASARPAGARTSTINYVSTFYKTGQTFSEATPVTVGASGSITQPIDIALTSTLQASQAPEIVGQAAPGKTLSVDPGTWTVTAGTTYSYQWLVGEAQVSTAPTYTVTKGDLGKTVRVVVTARKDDYVGSASTDALKVGFASVLKKAKAKKTVVKGKRVVQVSARVKVKGVAKRKALKLAKGRVVVLEGDVKVGKGRVQRGKLVVNLTGVVAGKHLYTVVYRGNGKVAAQTVEVKAKA